MKNKQGISLIVLVITIIVILILAGAVILSLIANNPIQQTKEAEFKANVDAYKSELNLAIYQKYLDDFSFIPDTFDVSSWDGNGDGTGTIKEYIPNITVDDAKKFKINKSKLVYIGDEQEEINWIVDVGISNYNALGIDVIASENTTINGAVQNYRNPVIPKGFMAINDGTTWPIDWNKGLVIEDESGNQFVWVPVDKVNVKYEKWCEVTILYDDPSVSDDSLPTDVISEMDQINKYGGFYIARFEAGKEDIDTLVSKRKATVWTNISYTNARSKAEEMYNTPEVKGGLVTGIQWDTVMRWLENSGFDVTGDSRSWGNFKDSIFPADVDGFSSKQTAGFSEYWKANNIYDLAGNTWEWTNEKYGSNYIYRGGRYMDSGIAGPAAYRYENTDGWTYVFFSFRPVLYIL